jgi:hypothetical protein
MGNFFFKELRRFLELAPNTGTDTQKVRTVQHWVQPPQQDCLTPIGQTLLLDEVEGARLHPVTIEVLPDFYCLGQFFLLVFYYIDSFL